jgi:hypothetical protein
MSILKLPAILIAEDNAIPVIDHVGP